MFTYVPFSTSILLYRVNKTMLLLYLQLTVQIISFVISRHRKCYVYISPCQKSLCSITDKLKELFASLGIIFACAVEHLIDFDLPRCMSFCLSSVGISLVCHVASSTILGRPQFETNIDNFASNGTLSGR